ncbi:TetR/AcrR family transcriptional regulator [Corticibacter populi]|uniref:TetR/AcrR family transcriptional regulator n=2 Tax=Corticibacter populi TaxID=1550736 RepID=A0A3M6QL11_9BURK|nr:TetR/AcrR family transcriptional regulator [Corticibacter populi]RMX03635.1 TetR/AcrR family transcriptional regulator [Corticibacter populi]RZS30028.1 TetR family transcriptional regulator [Corticibacter populi]
MPHSPPLKPRAQSTRKNYHHGHLREALIEAAVQLIEEQGVDKLSVREAAKRAGVSPGAPFRHFATRTALLTAVAEQAAEHLRTQVQGALRTVEKQPPLVRLAAIGHAYLGWASAHPTHFRVVSERPLIDYESSETLTRSNAAIREVMEQLLAEAFKDHMDLRSQGLAKIAARALVYGLARMSVDGHFPEWGEPQRATEQTMTDTLDFFIALLAIPTTR